MCAFDMNGIQSRGIVIVKTQSDKLVSRPGQRGKWKVNKILYPEQGLEFETANRALFASIEICSPRVGSEIDLPQHNRTDRQSRSTVLGYIITKFMLSGALLNEEVIVESKNGMLTSQHWH